MKTIKHFDTEFFSANVEVELEAKLGVEWKKGRLSANLWQQIVGFMMWSQNKYKAEAQLRLFYNTDTDEWAAVPYPQQPRGMTTKELPEENELRDKLRAGIKGDGWVGFGTVHHHCTASAFQSGTDEQDERNQPGFHITLGHLDKEELDVHCRFSHNGGFATCNLWDFINYPVQLAHFPRLIPRWYLMPMTYEFPALWTESIIEYKAPAFSTWGGSLRANSFHSDWETDAIYTAQWEDEKPTTSMRWYETAEEFIDDMMHKYEMIYDDIIESCNENSVYYHRFLFAAKDYDANPESFLKEIYDEYSTTTIHESQSLDTL